MGQGTLRQHGAVAGPPHRGRRSPGHAVAAVAVDLALRTEDELGRLRRAPVGRPADVGVGDGRRARPLTDHRLRPLPGHPSDRTRVGRRPGGRCHGPGALRGARRGPRVRVGALRRGSPARRRTRSLPGRRACSGWRPGPCLGWRPRSRRGGGRGAVRCHGAGALLNARSMASRRARAARNASGACVRARTTTKWRTPAAASVGTRSAVTPPVTNTGAVERAVA